MTLEEKIRAACAASGRNDAELSVSGGSVMVNGFDDVFLQIEGKDEGERTTYWREFFLVRGEEAHRVHPFTYAHLESARRSLNPEDAAIAEVRRIAREHLEKFSAELAEEPIGLGRHRDGLSRRVSDAATVLGWLDDLETAERMAPK